MSILTGSEIRKQVEAGRIVIVPFDPGLLNPNSIDVTLDSEIIVWNYYPWWKRLLGKSWREPKRTFLASQRYREKPFVMLPRMKILASTREKIATDFYAPLIEGKSTWGRKFLSIHCCAGFGDVGFEGTFTLELTCEMPIELRWFSRIAQVAFETVDGERDILYGRNQGRYYGQSGPTPAREDREIR